MPIGDIIGAGIITAALYNALRDYICKSTNVGDSEFPTKDDIPRLIEEIKKLEGNRGPRGPIDPKDKDRWRHLKDVLRRLQKSTVNVIRVKIESTVISNRKWRHYDGKKSIVFL